VHRAQLKAALVEMVPTALGNLTSILGQDCTEQGVLRILEAIQCPFLMKNLAFSLLDLLLLEVFPGDPDMALLLEGLDSMRTREKAS
jgi:hypothetical protein